MPKNNLTLQFNIDAWNAYAPGISTQSQWQEWADSGIWPEDNSIISSSIPPMMRRRMSSLSKLAVQTCIELLNEHDVQYLVFASRHGELHRSAKLISDIVSGEEASPMAFSQSVHNTAAGLATIATKKPIPLTSIAASSNTFQSALIEAWLYLTCHPSHKVLVVDFDEPLPDAYSKYENQVYNGYGLGLVVSYGDRFTITKQMSNDSEEQPMPQALTFLQHFLGSNNNWTITSSKQIWKWYQKP
ncbi:hypothetical protein VHA01S_005_00720 [Vibrio halioticoli NBRC 102217]|uniref:Beta-ketoacyl synthase-like N-terminal domain-containing protein n=1 Tax=Vibrio halioticoli NBRC 102217 TaxID=1219072 RepID=V5F046_9VIBR|nr:beta-ketoacyl synthase chain length factor [Vibrio halioticoli]GAD88469.1 hypothetical protein VHA01S_005_00720 [Vibrio halioticoli NBRC 102217]